MALIVFCIVLLALPGSCIRYLDKAEVVMMPGGVYTVVSLRPWVFTAAHSASVVYGVITSVLSIALELYTFRSYWALSKAAKLKQREDFRLLGGL